MFANEAIKKIKKLTPKISMQKYHRILPKNTAIKVTLHLQKGMLWIGSLGRVIPETFVKR
jgi:hypothetical protein